MTTLKRFRPSIESICAHAHCVEPPSSISCAHCSLTFCLRHLVEHQTTIDNEHKRLISSIDTCRTRLKTVQLTDNRHELFQQLDAWQTNMLEHVNRMKTEIDVTYERCDREFNRTKEAALSNSDDEDMSLREISTQLARSLHTLESSRLELIISKINPIIHLIPPNLSSTFSFDSQETGHLDVDRFLSTSTTLFTLDYDPMDTTVFATSSEHLIVYRSSRSIFQLFNIDGEQLYELNYEQMRHGDVNQVVWSTHLNGFLLATSKQLLKLNCTTKRIARCVDIGFGLFKDLCAGGQSIVLVHHLGTSLGDVVEHYSNNQLIQRCWKADLYPDEVNMKDTMEIFRIRMSGHLVAIDALFTDKILVCDVLHGMKCLFRIGTQHCSILSIAPVYDTQQWLLFVTDDQDESLQRRTFLIDAQATDVQRRMREIKCDPPCPTNICFFGPRHFMLVRPSMEDEENMLFECRKMRHVF